MGSPIFWSLTGLPVAAFLGMFFFKKIKDREANVDAGALKIKWANKEAQKRLATAKSHLDSGDSRKFYDEISKASLGYVSDKLSIPHAEMSKDNVRAKLESLNVSEPLVEDFVKVVKTCEMALFAGMDNSADMAATYEKAMAAIKLIAVKIWVNLFFGFILMPLFCNGTRVGTIPICSALVILGDLFFM